MLGRPVGSTVQLTTPTSALTGFTFDDDLGIDLAGGYRVRGTVFDANGSSSCELEFEAIPGDDLLVQLSWDTPTNDIDLHVAKQGSDGRFCIAATGGLTLVGGFFSQDCDNNLDCNYASCRPSSATGPEWDGVAGRTAGDPMLATDDLSGFGPESISVDVMTAGSYLVGANGYGMAQPSVVSVRIFVFGRLAAELLAEVDDDEWFEAAVVRWPADVSTEDPCIEDLTDGAAADDCG
jgi:hypothetical protein